MVESASPAGSRLGLLGGEGKRRLYWLGTGGRGLLCAPTGVAVQRFMASWIRQDDVTPLAFARIHYYTSPATANIHQPSFCRTASSPSRQRDAPY